MIIVAGWLRVDPASRDEYLAGVADVAVTARRAPGCYDFTQAADPVEGDRINVFERWVSDEDLLAFRNSGGALPVLPEVVAAEVHKYRISAVEAP
jgi:quinol monooxygenase YgiN